MEEIVKNLKQDGSPFAIKQLEVTSMLFLLEVLSVVLYWFFPQG